MLHLFRKWLEGDRTYAQRGTAPPRTARLNLETLEERASAATLFGLTTNAIIQFDSAAPSRVLAPVPIQGLNANERVLDIDFRPRTGQLFGLAVTAINSSTDSLRLLVINPLTGATFAVGVPQTVAPNFPGGAGGYGIDFEPSTDLLRVVNTGTTDNNFLIDPETGLLTRANPISAGAISSLAYDRNFDGSQTTAYAINSSTSTLQTLGGVNQNPSANGGILTTVGSLGVNVTTGTFDGFDVRTSGQQGGSGFAFAAFNFQLFSINLDTGAATSLGILGDGTIPLSGLAAPPDSLVAVGVTGGPADSQVNVINAFDDSVLRTITPFGGFTGNLSVGMDDVNRDAIPDVIVGAQAPNGHVKAFDGLTGDQLLSVFAFPGFFGSVSVTGGDVNGDGFNDIIATANGANAHVKALSGADGSELASFMAFPGFMGSASVAVADFDNDGLDEIVVSTGGPDVGGRFAIFDGSGEVFDGGALAFPGFNGATSVAAGDVDGDGIADIIVGAAGGGDGEFLKQDNNNDGLADSLPRFASTGGGHVKVFSGASVLSGEGVIEVASFFAYDPSFTSGISVGVADVNQDGRFEIQVAPLFAVQTNVLAFDGLTGQRLNSFSAVPVNMGVNVAGARGFNGRPS